MGFILYRNGTLDNLKRQRTSLFPPPPIGNIKRNPIIVICYGMEWMVCVNMVEQIEGRNSGTHTLKVTLLLQVHVTVCAMPLLSSLSFSFAYTLRVLFFAIDCQCACIVLVGRPFSSSPSFVLPLSFCLSFMSMGVCVCVWMWMCAWLFRTASTLICPTDNGQRSTMEKG